MIVYDMLARHTQAKLIPTWFTKRTAIMTTAVKEHDEQSALLPHDHHVEEQSTQDSSNDARAQVSTARLILILASNWISLVFTAIDATVVATLLVPMTNDFSSLKTLSWLGTSYLIASTAMLPLAGRLTDIFGRHAGAVIGDIVFASGTLVSGLAKTEGGLIFGRVLSGLGAGPVRVISSFITSDLVPTQQRGLVQGVSLVLMGAGNAAGGAVGGWIADWLGWRWAFLTQLPFLLLGTIMVSIFVHTTAPRSKVTKTNETALHRIDWLGSFTLIGSVTTLLVGINAGGNLVPWDDIRVLLTLPIAVVLFAAFIYLEGWHAHEPMLPLSLFKKRTVAAACLLEFFEHLSGFGILFYIPVYAQLRGATPARAGQIFIPQAIGNGISSILAGIIIRRTGHYMWFKYITIVCIVVSSAGFAMHDADTAPWVLLANMTLQGFGFGLMLVVGNIATLSSVDTVDEAVAISALQTVASVGSTLGISVAGAVFQNFVGLRLQRSLGSVKDADK